MRAAIPACIGVLLFTAVLRIFTGSRLPDIVGSHRTFMPLIGRVLLSQLLLPCVLLLIGTVAGLPLLWVLALTLVAAASPISGCPNLVLLMDGDAALALRWLMLGTAVLPITCLPVLYFLYPDQPISAMMQPSLVLLLLIGVSVGLALLVIRITRHYSVVLNKQAIDGVSALVLSLMVIGLMSTFHSPDTSVSDVVVMLLLAIMINVGLQGLGVIGSQILKDEKMHTISTGVVYGNRNIALFLTALPAVQMESLLLFIACYQVPMYLTPLIGDLFYRRLE